MKGVEFYFVIVTVETAPGLSPSGLALPPNGQRQTGPQKMTLSFTIGVPVGTPPSQIYPAAMQQVVQIVAANGASVGALLFWWISQPGDEQEPSAPPTTTGSIET